MTDNNILRFIRCPDDCYPVSGDLGAVCGLSSLSWLTRGVVTSSTVMRADVTNQGRIFVSRDKPRPIRFMVCQPPIVLNKGDARLLSYLKMDRVN